MAKPQNQATNSPGATGETRNGTVKRLVSDKGFGFIRTQNGNEYFFHRSGVIGAGYDDLAEGDKVTFIQGEGSAKGLRAEQVQRTE
jgi:cold shock protein